jgi:hypothetical protein
MTNFTPSIISQAPQLGRPNLDGTLVPVAQTSTRARSAKPVSVSRNIDTSNPQAFCRRKNVYLPNVKSAKTIWKRRDAHADLIQAALEAIEDDDVKSAAVAAAEKKYKESTWEKLPKDEQNIWETIANHVVEVEASYELVSPK